MKTPRSDKAQKILDDPKRAETLVKAILAAHESPENSAGSTLLVDGKLKVSMVRKVALGRPQD
jgi:hypothetical protein